MGQADRESARRTDAMIKRLEQVAALIVAAGLALMSHWLFFRWAQGGGVERRHPQRQSRSVLPEPVPGASGEEGQRSSETSAGLDQPLLGVLVVQARDMGFHLFGIHGKAPFGTDGHYALQRPLGILKGLSEQGLGEIGIGADQLIELRGMPISHRFAGVERDL